jgi:hypothetical protein
MHVLGVEKVALKYSGVRPMKIDIMFLVPTRMGFICRTKIFHYSSLLKLGLTKHQIDLQIKVLLLHSASATQIVSF